MRTAFCERALLERTKCAAHGNDFHLKDRLHLFLCARKGRICFPAIHQCRNQRRHCVPTPFAGLCSFFYTKRGPGLRAAAFRSPRPRGSFESVHEQEHATCLAGKNAEAAPSRSSAPICPSPQDALSVFEHVYLTYFSVDCVCRGPLKLTRGVRAARLCECAWL